MSVHVHVDHKPELEIFRDLLTGRCRERILLIQAPTGMGKTDLLGEYCKVADELGVSYAAVDLRLVLSQSKIDG